MALSPRIEAGQLVVELDGRVKRWVLPNKSNEIAIRRIQDEAKTWARDFGATKGQLEYITKQMRAAGYYVVGPGNPRGGRLPASTIGLGI